MVALVAVLQHSGAGWLFNVGRGGGFLGCGTVWDIPNRQKRAENSDLEPLFWVV